VGHRGRGIQTGLEVPDLVAAAAHRLRPGRTPTARNQRVPTTAGNSRPDVFAANAPALAWKRRSCGDGAKGPRLYDWAVASLPGADDGYGHWLLIRRSITDPTDLAYYLCFGPAGTQDEDLIRIAGTGWAVEECFQTAKTEVGLDHYQVRRYDA